MTQQIAQTSQGPIEYRLEGQGPLVMVLNGGHCSRESRFSQVATCELYEVPADTHLIWIGRAADAVWQKRLACLNATI